MKTEEKEKITIVSKKDLNISYFVGPGSGGQNKQKNATGVMIVHRASGAVGRASDTRSLEQNKKTAFQRLHQHPKMKLWIAGEVYRIREGETLELKVEREVNKQMDPKNLKIEFKDEKGEWRPLADYDEQRRDH